MTVTPISVVWSVLSILIAAACWFSLLQPYWFVHPDSFTSLGVYSYCLVKYDHPVSNSGHSSTDDQPLRCSPYGGQFQFSNLPSGAWQAACVLYGSGCVLMSICALLSLIVLCLDRKKDRRLALFTGYVQIVSAAEGISGRILLKMTEEPKGDHFIPKGQPRKRPGSAWRKGHEVVKEALLSRTEVAGAPSATLYTGGLVIFPAGLDASFVQHHCHNSRMYWSGSCVVGWAYILGIVADALAIFCPFLSHHIDTVVH